jgi:hypothetical protein
VSGSPPNSLSAVSSSCQNLSSMIAAIRPASPFHWLVIAAARPASPTGAPCCLFVPSPLTVELLLRYFRALVGKRFSASSKPNMQKTVRRRPRALRWGVLVLRAALSRCWLTWSWSITGSSGFLCCFDWLRPCHHHRQGPKFGQALFNLTSDVKKHACCSWWSTWRAFQLKMMIKWGNKVRVWLTMFQSHWDPHHQTVAVGLLSLDVGRGNFNKQPVADDPRCQSAKKSAHLSGITLGYLYALIFLLARRWSSWCFINSQKYGKVSLFGLSPVWLLLFDDSFIVCSSSMIKN